MPGAGRSEPYDLAKPPCNLGTDTVAALQTGMVSCITVSIDRWIDMCVHTIYVDMYIYMHIHIHVYIRFAYKMQRVDKQQSQHAHVSVVVPAW